MLQYQMIIKYISFLLGLIWSYSFIKTQSIFTNKTALLFKLFISKVSWITFVIACYYGYKNFSFQATLIGIITSVIIVHLGFFLISNFIKSKISEEKLQQTKVWLEYALIIFIVYFVFF